VLLRTELQQGHANQRAACQVEGPSRVLGGEAKHLGLTSTRRELGEVDAGEAGRRLGDELDGAAVDGREVSAKRLVALDEEEKGLLESVTVEGPVDTEDGGDVVGGAAGLELVEEPQALLGEGER
jgi:hypothetical protein